MSYAHVKVFQYYCKYKKDNVTLSLFFHLFNIQCTSVDTYQVQGFLSLVKCRKMIKVYVNNLKNFKDKYYLVTPLVLLMRVFVRLNPMFLQGVHTNSQTGPSTYIYTFNDISQ